ncbi:hypothetical protein [Microbacterium immunditiarum]|uniref:Uncharacterized protein n=1 Tax=Microbacterium immunditiarum TaxID=337480 RepID=A0A7Y9GML3_9MICO|nr:hypothetical protein [Microbacterium immunditiarum]NYE19106.1 hypothetical protein [Microbacterium immunditiarum]
MLSTIYASEVLFRHDTELRAQEARIDELRQERLAALAAEAAQRSPQPPRNAWPRPIGVAHGDALAACA